MNFFQHIHGIKGESTLQRGAKIVVTLYFFLGLTCLNLNHVIIMKIFQFFFGYYGGSKPKEVQKITFFCFI
jgi:hypothetical protein